MGLGLLFLTLCSLPVRGLAGPVNYTINFVTISGPPPTGSFTYDAASGFSNFQVAWHLSTLDFTSSANAPSIGYLSLPTGCDSCGPNAAYGFILISESATGCSASYQWEADFAGHFGLHFVELRFELVVASVPGTDALVGSTFGLPVGTDDHAEGTWSITQADAPEPGTLGTMLLASAALLAIARRSREHVL
jgi:hypothetical protein